MAFGIAFSVTPDSTAIEGSGQPSRRNATDARARRWYASAGMAARRTSTSGRAATVRVLSFRVHLKKARSVRPNAGIVKGGLYMHTTPVPCRSAGVSYWKTTA